MKQGHVLEWKQFNLLGELLDRYLYPTSTHHLHMKLFQYAAVVITLYDMLTTLNSSQSAFQCSTSVETYL